MIDHVHRRSEEMTPGALSDCKVLDLTTGGYAMCGKVLADMGAHVLKVEPPGGDPARMLPPFYGLMPDPERSLFWFYLNGGKRSITLDMASPEGASIFRKLVANVDLVLESFPPGYLDSIGLGYSNLAAINKGLILTSITPFGQQGPKANYVAGDLAIWASAGPLYITGDPDREPIDLGIHFDASFNAGAEAALGALVALTERETSGLGQQVDVSAQASAVQVLMTFPDLWTGMGVPTKRVGPYWYTGNGIPRLIVYPCLDGFVCFAVLGGTPGYASSMKPLIDWMKQEGKAPDYILEFDWAMDYDVAKMTVADIKKLEQPFIEFIKTKTKKELFDLACTKGTFIAPINSLADVVNMSQVVYRGFIQPVHYPELNADVMHPTNCALMSETPCAVRRRAPLTGEHNEEVFVGQLGIAKGEFDTLKARGVV